MNFPKHILEPKKTKQNKSKSWFYVFLLILFYYYLSFFYFSLVNLNGLTRFGKLDRVEIVGLN
jgi:hypothetical protein